MCFEKEDGREGDEEAECPPAGDWFNPFFFPLLRTATFCVLGVLILGLRRIFSLGV